MNKIILSLILCATGVTAAHAQYDYSSASRLDSIENAMATANARLSEMRTDSVHKAIWSNTSYFNIFYSGASTSTDIYQSQKAKFGVGLNVGSSYIWPRNKAWGNVVKIGFDIRYLDLQFAMYDKFARPLTDITTTQSPAYQGWTSDMGQTNTGSSDNSPNYATFDQMQLLAGLIGIGPTVTVAPLSFLDNAAAQLRLNLYFHYQPTFGANFYKVKNVCAAEGIAPIDGIAKDDESEMLSELGYVSMFDWGFKLQWRNFGLGFECRWGSGKLHGATYNPGSLYYDGNYVTYNSINMNGTSENQKSYTRKFAESRVYLNFNF